MMELHTNNSYLQLMHKIDDGVSREGEVYVQLNLKLTPTHLLNFEGKCRDLPIGVSTRWMQMEYHLADEVRKVLAINAPKVANPLMRVILHLLRQWKGNRSVDEGDSELLLGFRAHTKTNIICSIPTNWLIRSRAVKLPCFAYC